MIRCTSISKSFGGVNALFDISLALADGEVVGLIGPNGSGKSTLVNVLSGFVTPDAGVVHLDEREITGADPSKIRRLGLTRTFQNLRLHDRLSALDNVLVGLHLDLIGPRSTYWSWLAMMAGSRTARQSERRARDLAFEALESVDLGGRANDVAGSLSYGERKRLEIARATALPPSVLLLDEPTAGLGPGESAQLMDLVTASVRGSRRSILLIEHRLELVLDICDRVIVFDSGQLIASGPPHEISSDPEVRRIYVGGDA